MKKGIIAVILVGVILAVGIIAFTQSSGMKDFYYTKIIGVGSSDEENSDTATGNVVNDPHFEGEGLPGSIHWHPFLTVNINGQQVPIPVGLGANTHLPIHTHGDVDQGKLHMENENPTTETTTLGYFFHTTWGQTFNAECIFEYCTYEGTLRMYVNGEENFEFDNYSMRDKDQIVIEYFSFE